MRRATQTSFKPGRSGNPGGRPKGSKTYAVRELVAEALADPATREIAIEEFRKVLCRSKTVVGGLEFAAKVNREIGHGADVPAGGVQLILKTNIDPTKLDAARSRALPLAEARNSNRARGRARPAGGLSSPS
jgi:hypothetical protein